MLTAVPGLPREGPERRRTPHPRQDKEVRIGGDDYEALPDDLTLWCVYCGHHDDHSDFMTIQQPERVMLAASDLGMQMISQGLGDIFRRLSQSNARRSGVSFSYEGKPFYPRPLPGINEERLARIRTCSECQVQYAVFGEHRYCPVCGQLPATSIALDALQADTARLDALESLPPDAKGVLREQEVFTRSWVDTIENVVGVVEALGSALFRTAVPNAEDRLRGKGNIFQRLDDMADLFVAAGYDEPPDVSRTRACDVSGDAAHTSAGLVGVVPGSGRARTDRGGGEPQRVHRAVGVGYGAKVGVSGHVAPGGQVQRGRRVTGDHVHQRSRRRVGDLTPKEK